MDQPNHKLLKEIQWIIEIYRGPRPAIPMPIIQQRDFFAALWSLSCLGEAGRSVLPTLVENCITGDDIFGKREFSEEELGWIIDALGVISTKEDEEVVDFLVELLCDENQPSQNREAAARHLGKLQVDTPEVIECYAQLLCDPAQWQIWMTIVEAVARLDIGSDNIRTALIAALSAEPTDLYESYSGDESFAEYPENFTQIQMQIIRVLINKAWLPAEHDIIRTHMLKALQEITDGGYHRIHGM